MTVSYTRNNTISTSRRPLRPRCHWSPTGTRRLSSGFLACKYNSAEHSLHLCQVAYGVEGAHISIVAPRRNAPGAVMVVAPTQNGCRATHVVAVPFQPP